MVKEEVPEYDTVSATLSRSLTVVLRTSETRLTLSCLLDPSLSVWIQSVMIFSCN